MTRLVHIHPDEHLRLLHLHGDALEQRLRVMLNFFPVERLMIVYQRDQLLAAPRIMVDEPVYEARR